MRLAQPLIFLVIAIACLTVAGHACATGGGGGLIWEFQDTGIPDDGPTALGMRNGRAWPVIINDSAQLDLTPVDFGGSNWFDSSGGVALGPKRAATSVDGRVAVVAFNPPGDAIVTTSPTGNFGNLPSTVAAVTFDDSGNLVTATDSNVSSTGLIQTTGIKDVTVSEAGGIAVVVGNGVMHWANPITGLSGFVDPIVATNTHASLATSSAPAITFDSLGRPHIVGVNTDNEVVAFSFDIITGQWEDTVLGAGVASTTLVALEADSDRTVGAAWVDLAGTLHYAFKTNREPWLPLTVTPQVAGPNNSVGLAFDYNDFPVISYNHQGRVWLAYDPPASAVPEPTSAVVLGLGGFLVMKRSRRRSVMGRLAS